MAVKYTGGGGGGLLGALMQGASLAVPGLRELMPYIAGGSALLNGNPAGAVGAIGGKLVGDALGRTATADARNAANRASMNNAMMEGQRMNFDPFAPATVQDGSLTAAFSDGVNASMGVPETMPGDASGGAWTRQYRMGSGMPDFNTDPVTGQKQLRKKPWEV